MTKASQPTMPRILADGTCDWSTAFDRRVENVPHEWKGPLTKVIDTATAVTIGIRTELKMEPTAELVLGLTQLVMEEHRRDQEQEKERMEGSC